MLQPYISQNNQTIYDIVMQTYGDLNMTYKLIQDSGFTNIVTYPLSGTVFMFDPTLIADYSVYNYFQSEGLVLKTRIGSATVGDVLLADADGIILGDADGDLLAPA